MLGDTQVRATVEFRDVDGALADPPTVKVHWRDPDGLVTSYTYLTDDEVIRDSLGIFHMDNVVGTPRGKWWVRWEGVDLVNAEDSFMVEETRVVVT